MKNWYRFLFVLLILLILFLLKRSYFQKPTVIFSKDENSILMSNNNFRTYIRLDKSNRLESLLFSDGQGREINVMYSQHGISHYSIHDSDNYIIENSFYDDWPLEFSIDGGDFDDTTKENYFSSVPESIYRREKYNGHEKVYRINYKTYPYFFELSAVHQN